jgi:hexosaminidase
MTEMAYCYFDKYQADKKIEPLCYGGLLPLEKVYSYVPIPAGLTPEESKHVLGVHSCVWAEYVRTPEKAEYMTYPRLCALAEVAWTEPQNKNYAQFLTRIREHFRRFDFYGVNFRRLDK